jgi:hypothetical protein
MITCLPAAPKFFRTLGETKTFSRMGISLYSFLGFSRSGRTTGRSSGNTNPPERLQHSDCRDRSDKFDRLVEERELISRNNSAGDLNTAEVDASSLHLRKPNESEILRTVHIATEYRPELRGDLPRTGASDGKLWQGNHHYKAAVATPRRP